MKTIVKFFSNKEAYGFGGKGVGHEAAAQEVAAQIQEWANQHPEFRLTSISFVPIPDPSWVAASCIAVLQKD